MFMIIGASSPLYSLSLFLPTVVKDFGYTANSAQLIIVPPYVVACAFTILASYFADKLQQRDIFVLCFQSVTIIGFSLVITRDIYLKGYSQSPSSNSLAHK
ncbi:hypothetical protein ACMFMF_004725 [Clarireedia jacksonii]